MQIINHRLKMSKEPSGGKFAVLHTCRVTPFNFCQSVVVPNKAWRNEGDSNGQSRVPCIGREWERSSGLIVIHQQLQVDEVMMKTGLFIPTTSSNYVASGLRWDGATKPWTV